MDCKQHVENLYFLNEYLWKNGEGGLLNYQNYLREILLSNECDDIDAHAGYRTRVSNLRHGYKEKLGQDVVKRLVRFEENDQDKELVKTAFTPGEVNIYGAGWYMMHPTRWWNKKRMDWKV